MSYALRQRRFVLALSGSVLAMQAMPAYAQDEDAIIVTARRSEERLQDVPISVTVFNQEEVSRKNIGNSNDLAIYTPSMGQSNTLGNAQATFSLRGFNQEIGTSATVGVFFADVVAPRGASNQQPVGDGAGPGSFFDLQNVQVLKGPQGTLFGRNTTGGAVLIVPQKPTDVFEGYVEGSYGNYDMRRIQAVINVPLAETMRLRVGVDRQKRDGYVKNNTDVGPRDFNDVNYTAVRASLVADLTPDLENYTIATYTKSKTNGESNTLYAAQPASDVTLPGGMTIPGAVISPLAYLAQKELERYAGSGFYSIENTLPNPRTVLEQWQVINTTTWHSSDALTIKNIASYGELKYDLATPVFGTAFDMSDFNPYGQAFIDTAIVPNLPTGAPRPIYQPFAAGTILPFTSSNPDLANANTADQWTFTEELQFQGRAAQDRLTWQAGAYFERSGPLGAAGNMSPSLLICEGQDSLRCANAFFGFGSARYNTTRKTIQTVGLYAQGTYDLTDQLKFTAGLRYTWDKSSVVGTQRNYQWAYDPYAADPLAVSLPTGYECTLQVSSQTDDCTQSLSQKSSAPTWLLGLDYKPSRDILVYAKWARGYRTGGISLQAPPPFQEYGPEKVDTYEVGVKTTFGGAVHGTFNIAGFYNNFRDQQISLGFAAADGGGAGATGVVNAGKSRIYGIEVDSSIRPFAGFVVTAGYAYLNTRLQDVTVPTLPAGGIYVIREDVIPREGDQLANSPKHKLSANASYTLPLDDSIGEVTFGVTYTYTAKQISSAFDRDASGELTAANYLSPRNLFDLNASWKGVAGSKVDLTGFVTNLTKEKYFTSFVDSGQGFQLAQLGAPRMYGARLRYNF